MKPCQKCDLPLYDAVAFCPFCGTATSATGRKAAAAAGSAAKPAPVSAPVPVTAPAGVPGPDATPAVVVPSTSSPAPPAPPKATRVPPAVELPPHPAPKKGGVTRWIVAALVLAGVFFFMRARPDPAIASCNSAVDLGMKALAGKDLAAARLHVASANGVCQGALQSKAASLQAALKEADDADTTCLHSFHLIEGHLDDGKLASARTALYDLPAACAREPVAGEWRTRLAAAITAAQTVQATLRAALDASNLVQAKSALQKLTGANRENPDLAPLKAEVDQLAAELAAAAAPIAPAALAIPSTSATSATPAAPATLAPTVEAPSSTAAPRGADLPRERPLARRAEPETAPNPKADMAAAFLHDAEAALAQKKFDAARTYVDSARRMDPGNPRLDSMSQQIRERERQVLQQETIIR